MKKYMVITKIYGNYISLFLHTKDVAQQLSKNFKEHYPYSDETEIYVYHETKGYRRLEEQNENVQV